jgi:RNA polymerase sigma factor (TIGR02999 family)
MPDGSLTHLLARWADGDRAALDRLVPLVYPELRKIADGYLRRERNGHTLQPTALVHEAWLRLVKQDHPVFEHRRQFYALAAQVMRRILVDHARALHAEKRSAGVRTTWRHAPGTAAAETVDLLALDQALDRLAAASPRQAQVIELRYFGGLNLEEIAEILGVSSPTISRDQKTAEAWLGHVLAKSHA